MEILVHLSNVLEKSSVDMMKYFVSRPGKHRSDLLKMAGGRVVQMIKDNIQQAVQEDK